MSIVEALLDRLAFEPFSMMRATVLGDDRFYGWTPACEVGAGVFDAVQRNTFARGNLKQRRAKPADLYPRPEGKKTGAVELRPASVKEMDLTGVLSGWLKQ